MVVPFLIVLTLFMIDSSPTGNVTVDTSLDLKNYPEMFVTNGEFNGFIVVGENSRAVDGLVAANIAANMKIIELDSETVSISGDVWEVGAGSRDLEIADNSASIVQGENLYDITRYIEKGDLVALADGVFRTKSGSSVYKQFLYFDVDNTATNELVKYAENDDDVDDVFFFLQNGKNIGQYSLEFTSNVKSSIMDTNILSGFENSKLNILGQEYVLVLARRPQSKRVKLTLMGGAVSSSLMEGITETYQLGGESYEIRLTFVDADEASFLVNGENTGKLRAGDVFKLSDGKEIGVSEILYQAYAGGVHSADFFLGANKLVLKDDDITDSVSDAELEVASETIDGADVIIEGTDDGTEVALSIIKISMTAQEDYYVAAGEKLSDVIRTAGDEEEILFTNNWDIEFKGLSEAKSHGIKLDNSGDRRYDFIFYDGSGDKVKLPLFYAQDDTTISFGEEASSKCLILNEAVAVQKDDYFILTGGDASSGSAVSYALQYKSADESTKDSPQIKFKNLGNGEMLKYSIDTSSTDSGSAVADIKLGGYTFPVISDEVETSANFNIKIAMDGGSAPGSDDIDIVDEYGAKIDFGSIPSSGDCRDTTVTSSAITITTPDGSDYESQQPAEIVLVADATATNKVTVSSFTVGGTSNPLIGSGSVGYGYTSMGGKMTYDSSSAPHSFIYDYPEQQRIPLLYVTSRVEVGSTKGDLVSVAVKDATKLDSEIAVLNAQNLIVVGGPCSNTITAKLLGNTENCFEGFSTGKSMIKLLKNGNKVALIVAGYGGSETRLAGGVLENRWTELSGKEVEIFGDVYVDAEIVRVS
jgi:hypothetical protein